jgi:hypothetical protein
MPRAVVMSNFSRAGVGDAHFRQPDFFHVLDRRKVSKVRVEEIVGLSGLQLQGKTLSSSTGRDAARIR